MTPHRSALVLTLITACASPPELPPEGAVLGWDGALLALVDGDMAGTAYADNELHPIAEASDGLFRVMPDTGGAGAPLTVPNTVMGWPGSMTLTPDGQRAYVVTSRGSPAPGTERYESVYTGLPYARALTTVDVGSERITGQRDVCERPSSVDFAPSGAYLLVACGDDEGELAVVPLDADGAPGAPRVFDLDVRPPDGSERDAGASYAAIHPGGEAAGVVLKNRAVVLARFTLDADGVPVSATAEAPVAAPDRWLSVARWTRGGRHLLVADVGWGPGRLDAVLNGDGAIVSYALSPDDDRRGQVGEATVSKSPEAFEVNSAGDLLAVVNMERTYLPGGFTALFRGRDASSLSLVDVDRATGTLRTLGEPVPFRGVLPEDATFDADGDRIAVAVYQDHDAPRSDGWIAYFAVEGSGDERLARQLPVRTKLPRGVHDLVQLD